MHKDHNLHNSYFLVLKFLVTSVCFVVGYVIFVFFVLVIPQLS